jgi:uncharacterized membrane protein YdjX (TVP38/TMEM64 family)
LRLIPLVSFDAISYAAGLSSIRFRAFLLATALGMMPGTFAFVYVGGSGSGPRTWAVLLGLAVLAAGAYVFQRRFSRPAPASARGPGWKPGGRAHMMCCS